MRTEADRTAPPIRATRRAARRRAWRALRPRRLVVRCCQGKPMCTQAREGRPALQAVANGEPVQGFRSFATPNKVVHQGGTQDPIRGFCNLYYIGFSAILRSLDESHSLPPSPPA